MRKIVIGALLGALFGATAAVVLPAIAAPSLTHHINALTCTPISNTALSTSSETVLAANANRKKVCIVNNDATIAIYVKFGATAATTDTRIAAGGSICESPESGHVYTGVIDAIAASGTPAISGFECE